MIKFGKIKSKIENLISESYSNGTFKTEIKNFKKNILENNNFTKLFYLYDDITSKKGLSESIVEEYVNQCIIIYENTINKINPNDLKKLETWVKGVDSNDQYDVVDNLFSSNILTLETKIFSKKTICENLQKTQQKSKEPVKLPLKTIVSIANKTINNYIETLSESDKKEISQLLDKDDKELELEFNNLKEDVSKKLISLKESDIDLDTKEKLSETINKVISEEYNKLSYFKLKNLSQNI
jgi:hypothetical protein